MVRLVALAVFSLALAGAPFAAEAQQPATKIPRIGVLASIRSPATDAFEQGLRERGWVDGKTVAIDWRLVEGRFERLPEFAAALAASKPDVILAAAFVYATAASRATRTIPIVFALIPDPVAAGFVASLARPGGNMTGLASLGTDLAFKRLELLTQVVPGQRRIGVLTSTPTPTSDEIQRRVEAAGRSLGLDLLVVKAESPGDLEEAFAAMAKDRVSAVLEFPTNPMFYAERSRIVRLAARHRLPAIYESREYVDVGGLMSYAANYPDLMRRSAYHVDRILKGAKPADLPVEQPTKFELVINMRTAKALGLTIPPAVLARADQVIE
jgi:putative ABC transport system substrate-binding protein